MGILAGTEIESIDALRTARADPERIVECIDGIVGKGVADMRFQPQEAEADADVAMRLAEALLGINRHDCFTRAVHVLERVRETVKSGPHAAYSALWHELMASALILCGRAHLAMGVAVSGVCVHKDNVKLLYLLGILRAGARPVRRRRGCARSRREAPARRSGHPACAGRSSRERLARAHSAHPSPLDERHRGSRPHGTRIPPSNAAHGRRRPQGGRLPRRADRARRRRARARRRGLSHDDREGRGMRRARSSSR